MRVTRPAVALMTLAVIAGCSSDSTAPAAGRAVSLSFVSATPVASNASFSSMPATASDSIAISKVELVFARVELQRVGATCTDSTEAGDDDHRGDDSCAELELAPTVVTVPTTGTVTNALAVNVPKGSYSALEAKLRPVDQGRGTGSRAFLADHPDLAHVSVRVTGTFNGKAFTYTGQPRAELEMRFNPALAVDTGAVNLTVQVDIASWFKSPSGALIDPSTANANGPISAIVADNIRRSLRAFRDDDRNGHDDEQEHHGGSHG